MSDLDNLLEMLASPEANVRYDACEALRAADESSEQAVMALENALNDPDRDVAQAARRALQAVVHQQMLESLGREMPRTQAEIKQEEETRALAGIILVTTPSIDGYRVSAYLGIVSAEVIIRAAPLSDFGGGSGDLRDQLDEAKDSALRQLLTRAHKLQANAILSVNLGYSALPDNVLVVAVHGTAVKIEVM